MPSKLSTSFDRLKDADFLVKADVIITTVYGHPFLVSKWSGDMPSQATARAALDQARSTHLASQTRDTLKIADRETAREHLTAILQEIAACVELLAKGDAKVLSASGFDQRRAAGRPSGAGALPSEPEGLRVQPTLDGGTLNLSLQKVPGAAACEVQINQGDPGDETGWQHAQTVVSQRSIRLEGVKPGRTWARVRGVSRGGAGPWGAPVTAVVI